VLIGAPLLGGSPSLADRATACVRIAGVARPTSSGSGVGERRERRFSGRLGGLLDAGSNPGGVIYGTITIGALLAAESARQETYSETVGAAMLALVLFWLAHAYAHLLGDRLAGRGRLSAGLLLRALIEDAAILRGALAPLVAMLIAWALGATLSTAVAAAVWTAAGSLVAWELAAGLRAHLRPAELVFDTAVGAALGMGIILIKVVLHP
jgi:hypothetical protein